MSADSNSPSLTRWYIDTRPLTSSMSSLPLLDTLQPCDQETVRKYYHLADRHMSLASYLLKYLFIHRTCHIPWREINISRTPAPHHRPCFIPSSSTRGTANRAIEFNVSHQASLVALAGTILQAGTSEAHTNNLIPQNSNKSTPLHAAIPQLGIDITCVDERSRRSGTSKNTTPSTATAVADFVDIFAEVFSPQELQTMKTQTFNSGQFASEAEAASAALRLFYTYWALKEAYIKMTGEALLAPWLRELVFTDVAAPEPLGSASSSGSSWSAPYTGVRTWLYGQEVMDVRIEVVGFEEDYIVATAARGGEIGARSRTVDVSEDPWQLGLESVDIDQDIKRCATGPCGCLDG